MSDWAQQVAVAEAAAQSRQAAEAAAEGRFDAIHVLAESRSEAQHVTKTDEFRAWMTARHATDEAWGAWSVVMDAKPAA